MKQAARTEHQSWGLSPTEPPLEPEFIPPGVELGFHPASISAVVRLGLTKRKTALDVSDAAGRELAEASLGTLDPNWQNIWGEWAAAGYPKIS